MGDKFDINTDTTKPEIGKSIVLGFMVGTECEIVEVKAIEHVESDNKVYLRPDNIEIKKNDIVKGEGNELVFQQHKTNPDVMWVIWAKRKHSVDIDQIISDLYATEDKVEGCKIMYKGLFKFGSDIKLWEEFFEKLDTDKINISVLIAAFVTARSHRFRIPNYNKFYDGAVANYMKHNNKTLEEAEELLGKWSLKNKAEGLNLI